MATMKNETGKRILRSYYILFILIGVFVVLNLSSGGLFLAQASITNILRVGASPLIIAVPATLLLITGNIDLSVGGMCSMVAVIYAHIVGNTFTLPILASMFIVIGVGAAAGWFNGLLVAKLKITSVIATLATMSLFWGIAKVLVPQDKYSITNNMPENMMIFAKSNAILNIPPSMVVCIIAVVIFVILEKKSILGKYAIAVGGNQVAAQLAGINAQKITWIIYVLTGAMTGVAGVIRASYMNAGDMNVGTGLEVLVIIAILLGGTSFSGGKGSILKTVAAVFILVGLDKGLTLMGVPSYWSMLVNGIVFITALVIDNAMTLNEISQRRKAGINRSLSRIEKPAD